jgi:uncharacterized cupin superfamily protein
VGANLFGDDWDERDEDPNYGGGYRQLRPVLGATKIGGTVYELLPGCRICPYHWHFAEEEWLLVLAGTPTLRTPDGMQTLTPWDVVVFPCGPAGAHDVRNETAEPVRVLMLSSNLDLEVAVYPDSNKVGAFARIGEERVRMLNRLDANLDYLDGEEGGAA